MKFPLLFVFLCVSLTCVHSFPIGVQNSSEEIETTTDAENVELDSQEAILEEQLNEVEEDVGSRKKRGLYSSERTEEEVEYHVGLHHRERRHAEHHDDVQSSDHGHQAKRSASEGVMAKDDHHGAQKRSSDGHQVHQKKKTTEEQHASAKRSADDHHEHQKRSADDHHEHQKRSAAEHVEHHDHQKRNAPEGDTHGHLQKRSAGEGHRHHRSADQGIDEDEPEDEIETDETTESDESRKRREATLPTFPSDHDSEHSNSVAVRVKRVSRAGSSHKVRTLNKNRGNSKAGETTQNDTPSSGVFSP